MEMTDMMNENPYIQGNEEIAKAITKLTKENIYENFVELIELLTSRMEAGGHFILQAQESEGEEGYRVSTVRSENGTEWLAVFTDVEEYKKSGADEEQAYTQYIAQILLNAKDMPSIDGVVVNPFGDSFSISKQMIDIFGIQLVDPEEAGVTAEMLN